METPQRNAYHDLSVGEHTLKALESIRDHAGLSRDVAEVVTRALGS